MRKRKRGAAVVARDCSEAKEDHKCVVGSAALIPVHRKPIYHIATLHPPCPDGTQLFATIGANRVTSEPQLL